MVLKASSIAFQPWKMQDYGPFFTAISVRVLLESALRNFDGFLVEEKGCCQYCRMAPNGDREKFRSFWAVILQDLPVYQLWSMWRPCEAMVDLAVILEVNPLSLLILSSITPSGRCIWPPQ